MPEGMLVPESRSFGDLDAVPHEKAVARFFEGCL
jgi:hypothetical protein